MKILLKNIHCIDPRSKLDGKNDVLIESGVIKKIGKKIDAKVTETIDGSKLHLFPGFLDLHVHLREPGEEHKETIETAVKAALNGGIVGMVSMPNTNPICDKQSVVEYITNRGESLNYNIFPSGSPSVGNQGEELSEIAELKEAGVIALSDGGDGIDNARLLRHILEYANDFDLPIFIQPRENQLAYEGVVHEGTNATQLGLNGIPRLSETVGIFRDIELAKLTGAHIHFSPISIKESASLVNLAKKQNILITSDVSPEYFTLVDEDIKEYDPNFKIFPPLREEEDKKEILKALKSGAIDVISSHHTPHLEIEKDVDFDEAPFGCSGLETAVGVTINELYHKAKMGLDQIASFWNTNPAKIIGKEDFGAIKEGSAANLTIIDLEAEWEVDPTKFNSKSKGTLFEGKKLKGKPVYSICRGKLSQTSL